MHYKFFNISIIKSNRLFRFFSFKPENILDLFATKKNIFYFDLDSFTLKIFEDKLTSFSFDTGVIYYIYIHHTYSGEKLGKFIRFKFDTIEEKNKYIKDLYSMIHYRVSFLKSTYYTRSEPAFYICIEKTI